MPEYNLTPDGASTGDATGDATATAPVVSFEERASGLVIDEENDIEVWIDRDVIEYRRGEEEPMEFPKGFYPNGKGGMGISTTLRNHFEGRREVAEHLRKALEVMGYDPVEVKTL